MGELQHGEQCRYILIDFGTTHAAAAYSFFNRELQLQRATPLIQSVGEKPHTAV